MNDTSSEAAMPSPAPDVPPPSPPPLPSTTTGAHDSLIERWWNDHFPGSPVAAVTAAWNHAFAAKEELKRRLAALKEDH
ncbi:MAG TPA: hypothetical protein VM782_21045 [Stellaceae bacterium]|nr:hypothetical protein [Stellaceae bacterium]